MADGVTHEYYLRKGWFAVLPLSVLLLVVAPSHRLLWALLLCFNFLICDFLDPDADQLGWSKAEGDFIRTLRRVKLGIIGVLWFNWWTLYAEIILMFGGHRSWASHGWIIGTLGRMFWFNLIPTMFLYGFYLYGLQKWNLETFGVIGWRYFHMHIWLIPYLVTQFIAWVIGDGIHIVLDTDWFKNNYGGKDGQRLQNNGLAGFWRKSRKGRKS